MVHSLPPSPTFFSEKKNTRWQRWRNGPWRRSGLAAAHGPRQRASVCPAVLCRAGPRPPSPRGAAPRGAMPPPRGALCARAQALLRRRALQCGFCRRAAASVDRSAPRALSCFRCTVLFVSLFPLFPRALCAVLSARSRPPGCPPLTRVHTMYFRPNAERAARRGRTTRSAPRLLPSRTRPLGGACLVSFVWSLAHTRAVHWREAALPVVRALGDLGLEAAPLLRSRSAHGRGPIICSLRRRLLIISNLQGRTCCCASVGCRCCARPASVRVCVCGTDSQTGPRHTRPSPRLQRARGHATPGTRCKPWPRPRWPATALTGNSDAHADPRLVGAAPPYSSPLARAPARRQRRPGAAPCAPRWAVAAPTHDVGGQYTHIHPPTSTSALPTSMPVSIHLRRHVGGLEPAGCVCSRRLSPAPVALGVAAALAPAFARAAPGRRRAGAPPRTRRACCTSSPPAARRAPRPLPLRPPCGGPRPEPCSLDSMPRRAHAAGGPGGLRGLQL
ncbi:MAG: hypothetical protein J3K34DRAFT_132343 [Monoraphidium minutum]|nr:MAG: hypothetical protein J3K34DRAFT_132343 [Monoraphidium minutum]